MANHSREMQPVVPLTRTLEKLIEQSVRTIECLQLEFDGAIYPRTLDAKQAGIYLLLLMYNNQLEFLQHMLQAEHDHPNYQRWIRKRIDLSSSPEGSRFPYHDD